MELSILIKYQIINRMAGKQPGADQVCELGERVGSHCGSSTTQLEHSNALRECMQQGAAGCKGRQRLC
jgi:hypothetical protein